MIWNNSNKEFFETTEEGNTWVFATLLDLLEPWRIIGLLANAPDGMARTINKLVEKEDLAGVAISITKVNIKACGMNEYDKVDEMLRAFECQPFWNSEISSITDISIKDINARRKQLEMEIKKMI